MALVSASAGCAEAPSAAAGRDSQAAEPRPVKVIEVRQTPIVRSITVTGTLAAEEQVVVSFKVTGRLDQLLVDLGSRVTRGQLIAKLAPEDFELRLAQAEAALQQARVRLGLPPDGEDDTVDLEQTALVRQNRAAMEEARLQRDRIQTFVNRGISAKAELDTANAQLQIAEGRYQDALEEGRNRQAILAQRRSEVAIARQQLQDSELRSPIDGVVRERHVFAGEYRAAGTPIVTVVRQHPLRLQLAVPERSASEVRLGQVVRVTVEGDPAVYQGRVVRLSPAISEDNRTLPIEAEIPNEDGRLRPGTFARADIVTREQPGLVVPQSALVTFAGVDKVLMVKDGKAAEQRVRTGDRIDTDRVEIVDGLEPGAQVIVEPGGIGDGALVTASR